MIVPSSCTRWLPGSNSQSYDETAAIQFWWASVFFSIGFLTLLTWLLACTLTWKPAAKS